MDVTDTWIPVLNALGIAGVNEVLAIRDRLHISTRNKKCSIVSGISIVLRIMKYNIPTRDISIVTNASNHGLNKVKSILSDIDALTGNDTSDVDVKKRINAIRENLVRAGMDIPDHSPKNLETPKREHACTYCGAPGATLVHATGPRYRAYFCDQFCKHAWQCCSMLAYYTIPGRLRPADKYWFIDVPLERYNKFYNRNIDEATFIESVAIVIRSSKDTTFADALFLGYYMASRAVCKDFIPHEVYIKGHANPRRARRGINEKVFYQPSCNRDDRATSLLVKGAKDLADSRIIEPDDVDKIKLAFNAIRGRIDSGASRTVAVSACYYIITRIIKKKISPRELSIVFGVSTNRMTHSKIATKVRNVVLNLEANA